MRSLLDHRPVKEQTRSAGVRERFHAVMLYIGVAFPALSDLLENGAMAWYT
jgi:hypothetical protein